MVEVTMREQKAIQSAESGAAPEQLALRAFAAVHHYAMTPGLHKKAWMATVRGRDAGRGAKESQVEHGANLNAAASRSKRREGCARAQ